MIRYLAIRNLAVIESVAVEFEPAFNVLTGETGAGQVHPGRSRRSAARRARHAGPAPHRRGSRHRRGHLRVRGRRRDHRAARDHRDRAAAAPSSMAPWPPPRHCKDLANRLVELHGQHEHQQLLDPAQHLLVLDDCGQLDTAARADGWGICPGARHPAANGSPPHGRPRARGPTRAGRIPAGRAPEGRAPGRGGRGALGGSADPPERRSCPASLPGKLRRVCTTPSTPCSPGSTTSGSASGSWPPSTPRFVPYLEARDGMKAQLEDLAFTLRDFADGHRRISGPPPGGRGPARPARAPQAEARAHTRRRDRPTRRPGRGARRARGRQLEPRRSRARAWSGPPPPTCSWPGTCRPGATTAAERLARAHRTPNWATSRWSELASRSGSRDRHGRGAVDGARHRPGRVLPVGQRRRGASTAGAHRLGRRAVARDARPQDRWPSAGLRPKAPRRP